MSTIPSQQSFSLLFVEDESESRDMVIRMVADEFPNCTLYTADNGLQGIELFKQFAPDIVMTDLNMPMMNGVEMIKRIKSINTDTKYIVLSAYNHINIFGGIKETGICAFLSKPIHLELLFETIKRCAEAIKAHRPND